MKKKVLSVERLQTQIDLLGSSFKLSAYQFLSIGLVTSVGLMIYLYYFTNIHYLLVPIIALVYYYLLYYLLIIHGSKVRCNILEEDALEFFEILTLTLESGRNLENSLELTVENTDSELSFEFGLALKEIKYGKSFAEALKSMRKRIPSDAINNVILSIIEANTYGGSILDNMYNQIEFLRDKKLLKVRESINKIPNKISIISVLLMVPLMMIIILGPLFIRYIIG